MVNATKHCQNARHENILWCPRRLQQPERGSSAQYRSNVRAVKQEDCQLPKDNFRDPLHLKISTSEILQDTQKEA